MVIMFGIGTFQLECDGARAYDEAAKLLKGPTWKLNFASETSYLEARGRELQKRGIGFDEVTSYDIVYMQIKDKLKKISFGQEGVFRLVP